MLPQRKTTRRPSPTRRALRLLDPRDGAEILLDHRRSTSPLTPWVIEVEMDDPTRPEYAVAFRPDDDGAGVVVTLSLPGTALYPLQVRIGGSGDITYENHIPLVVRVHPRTKTISVRFLATVRVVPEGVAVTYRP